jgi:hypothetical protein
VDFLWVVTELQVLLLDQLSGSQALNVASRVGLAVRRGGTSGDDSLRGSASPPMPPPNAPSSFSSIPGRVTWVKRGCTRPAQDTGLHVSVMPGAQPRQDSESAAQRREAAGDVMSVNEASIWRMRPRSTCAL